MSIDHETRDVRLEQPPAAAIEPHPRRTRRLAREFGILAICLVIILPAFVPVGVDAVLAPRDGLLFTGFVQRDMPYYMANAREYLDSDRLSLFYGLPFSADEDTPRIYFQPQTALLAVALRATGWDPATVFLLFGILAALACARVALALYRQIVGFDGLSRRVGFVIFFWGGGLLSLAALVNAAVAKGGGPVTSECLVRFDPAGGWWFLNFGRNLVYPTEAYYHAMFLGSALLCLRGRPRAALIVAALLSLSHPFTGLQLLLVLSAWGFLERRIAGSRSVPRMFPWLGLGLIALHLAFYLVWLRQSAEHRAVQEQWGLSWLYQWRTFVPALALVGMLAAWELRSLRIARSLLAAPAMRFSLVCFVVSFALAKHELVARPVQPLHFTRGYDWLALFFLGSGALVRILDRIRRLRFASLRAALLVGLVAVFLSDNVLWFSTFHRRPTARSAAVCLTPEEAETVGFLDRPEMKNCLLLYPVDQVSYFFGYLATVYTPLRPWYSHFYITPYARARSADLSDLYEKGLWRPDWDQKRVVAVIDGRASGGRIPEWAASRRLEPVFRGSRFIVLMRKS